MTEEFSKDLLSAYFDEELALDERAKVERKLHAEPTLREELEQLSQLSNLLGDLQKDSAPEDLQPAVMQQIERDLLLGKKFLPQFATPQARKKNQRFLTGILLLAAAGIVIAISFLISDPVIPPDPVDVDQSGKGRIAKTESKAKKKPANSVIKEKKPKAAILAAKPTSQGKKILAPPTLQWDEIIASLDYSNDKTAVIELDAEDDKELLKKIQQILMAAQVSLAEKSSPTESSTTGIRSVYFEGPADRLKEVLRKLTKESWWKQPTLRGSVNPQTVQLAKGKSKKPKTKRFGVRSFAASQKETLSQKVAQARQKLQAKKKQSSGSGIESLTKNPKPKTKQKTQRFQMPVQIDKQSWEKTRPKAIKPQKKTKATKKAARTLRILIVIKKK